MRRLDWFLAAIVATFLLGAILIQASVASIGGLGWSHPPAPTSGEISVRRLVSHLPQSPILPGDAR